MEKQSLETLLNQGESIERIARRFGKDPSTVSYWLKKHRLTSPYAAKHAARGGIERERLEELVRAGMTIAEIGDLVQRSKATVRHWLREYGLKTLNTRGSRRGDLVGVARDTGKLVTSMKCERHGVTDFVLEGRGITDANDAGLNVWRGVDET